jgi:hypothetical protein
MKINEARSEMNPPIQFIQYHDVCCDHEKLDAGMVPVHALTWSGGRP